MNKIAELESLLQQHLHHKEKTSKPKRIGGKAVVYTRVSSQEQAEGNSSLSTQLKLCTEYCSRQGIEVKQCFGGTYESAKTDGRPEFQRMLSYVRRDKEISFIIVYNLDRFSRSGAGAIQLAQDLREMGVVVKSVSQNTDSSTAAGRLQEGLLHIFNRFDNDTRSDRTSTNTRELLLKGYWCYAPPLGYENLKPKHKATEHQYRITEKGWLIKKAFQWKIEGTLTNKEICKRLRERGLLLTEKNFRFVISNPFYAGYVTGKLLDGKYVKGHHPPLISLELFLKANEVIAKAVNTGIPKKHKQENLPLKIFAREEESGSPLTGFKQKGIWYYKARGKQVRMSVNAQKLNAQFEGLLSRFQYRSEHKEKLRGAILQQLKTKLASALEEGVQLKKRITELEHQIEGIEERHVLGQLSEELYHKYTAKYREEIKSLQQELSKNAFSSSNLEMAVEKGLKIAENISGQWLSADFDRKRKLQYLLFPEGISYDKKNDRVQTGRVNALFDQIEPQKRIIEDKEKGNSGENCLKSDKVIRIGFKPMTYCLEGSCSIQLSYRTNSLQERIPFGAANISISSENGTLTLPVFL